MVFTYVYKFAGLSGTIIAHYVCYSYYWTVRLLVVGTAILGGSTLSSAAAGDTAHAALSVRRVGSQVNVFLGVGSHEEGRNVDELLANTNVLLSNQYSGVVDRLGQVKLEHLGLKSALHEVLGGELEDIIERVLILSHNTVSLKAADKGRGLKHALGVLSIKGQKGTGGLYVSKEYWKRVGNIRQKVILK